MLVLIGLLACGSSDAPTPASEPEPAPALADADLHKHMQEHFAAVSSARNAVIAGALPDARERLKWLAEHEPNLGLPAKWTPHIVAMQAAANAGSGTEGAEGLGKAVAAVAGACGSCHAEMDKGPTFEGEPEGEASNHMVAHNIASEKMWQGIISGKSERWLEGAGALVEQAPLEELTHPEEGAEVPGAVATLGMRVHELGAEGLSALDRDKQIALYGELIGTCALCHAVSGGATPE